jgi:hypothetical protein
LERERDKLTQAYLADALPVDVLKREQRAAYERAEPEVRRQLIQAAFDKLWISDDEIAGCGLKPGFTTVL